MKVRLGRRSRSQGDRPGRGGHGDRGERDDGGRAERGNPVAARLTPPPPARDRARLVVGAMTGTSLDGLDAALVRIHGRGLAMRVEHVNETSLPLGDLGPRLRAIAEQRPVTAGEVAACARDLALLHLEAVRALGRDRIDLVVAHGQTVFHAPPLSWQLLNPAPLAYALGVPVVHDLRAADLAHGGQGAPITPLADHVLFRAREPRAVINLGGFCNLTLLPGGDDATRVRGGDVCACNQVLDRVAREALGAAYDKDGSAAMRGTAERKALAPLADALALQARSGRSLGTGDELGGWIERWRARLAPDDLARTACAAIAQVITRTAGKGLGGVGTLVLAGGGARNRALVAELTARAGMKVVVSDKLGVPSGMREAIGMAVLGALCQDRIPITIPAVTGVDSAPIAGVWTLP